MFNDGEQVNPDSLPQHQSLLAVLAELAPLDEEFPPIIDLPPEPVTL